MATDSSANPKIIVDEDWKSRVQAEKEQLKKSTSSGADSSSRKAAVPPASFDLLVTTLATQAMACLGQIPDPESNKPVVHLDLARHYIDTLEILESKTQGNLTSDEQLALSGVLHNLRMLYVQMQKHASGPPPAASSA